MQEGANNQQAGEGQAAGVAVPKISEDQAEKIILGLNEQFADKVLKKLKDRPEAVAAAEPWEVSDFSIKEAPGVPGESLSQYLSRIRAELPEHPFADEDSSRDLSRLKALKAKVTGGQ